MSISLGLVGLGNFGRGFAPLFKSHPQVSRIGLCDREPERIKQFTEDPFFKDKFNPRDVYDSLDAICKSDFDALAIITQPWLHAPQCIQAMKAGKHVYSAVPIISIPDGDEILDWCNKIIETCKATGMKYMLGETTFFHADSMFCRRKATEGAFGDFVYAEGEYYHDVDSWSNLREVSKSRLASKAGGEWVRQREIYKKRGVKGGPMHYPTHSVSGPVSVMKAHALKATAYGYRNNNDPFFKQDAFSNETALYKMSNGATVRICEFREISRRIREGFSVLGTRGSFAEGRWQTNGRVAPLSAHELKVQVVPAEEMRDPLPRDVQEAFNQAMKCKYQFNFNPYGMHGGSHPYLVHEFVDAVASGRMPAINAWEASRYMAMGVMAHKSALKDGETLNVPDWGDAPAL